VFPDPPGSWKKVSLIDFKLRFAPVDEDSQAVFPRLQTVQRLRRRDSIAAAAALLRFNAQRILAPAKNHVEMDFAVDEIQPVAVGARDVVLDFNRAVAELWR